MALEEVTITLHILSAAVAVGAVITTDFLHLKGLKNHSLEKKLLGVYPYLTQIIYLTLAALLITGLGVLHFRPWLLQGSFFQLKMALFTLVIINGVVLNHRVGKLLETVVKTGNASKRYLIESSLFGSLSVVTWISIFVLALTKDTGGYSIQQFLTAYTCLLALVFIISYFAQATSHSTAHQKKQ